MGSVLMGVASANLDIQVLCVNPDAYSRQYMATGKPALSTVVLSTLKKVTGRRRRGHRRHRRQLLSITPAMGGRP